MLTRAIRNWWSSRAGVPQPVEKNLPDDSEVQPEERTRLHLERARALQSGGDARSALDEVECAAKIAPDNVEVLVEQGRLNLLLGEIADARDCFQLAVAHSPSDVDALLGLARTLRRARDAVAARPHIESAQRLAPARADVHFEAAGVMGACDDLPAAVAAYARGLELDAGNAAMWSNFGLLYLNRLGDAVAAEQCFRRAIALEPATVGANANLGLALDGQGRTAEALEHYGKLIAEFPDEAEYRWNRGLALLASGNYARGWEDYELRNGPVRGTPPRDFPFETWRGEALPAGSALLVYAEQGVGDEIMFASCLPELSARVNCVVECDVRLEGLFKRSFPHTRVHAARRDGERGWLDSYPDIGVQTAIGSLPRFMRRSASDFPDSRGYLIADPARVTKWRDYFAQRAGTQRRIGIAWRGGTRATWRELRSVEPHRLAPLLEIPCLWVNLQRGGAEELARLHPAHAPRIVDCSDAADDIDELAALCMALDAVVTVDNTLAHLAGALGRATSIMLAYNADWRWVRGSKSSAWYPAARLYRQHSPGAWDDVVRELANDVAYAI